MTAAAGWLPLECPCIYRRVPGPPISVGIQRAEGCETGNNNSFGESFSNSQCFLMIKSVILIGFSIATQNVIQVRSNRERFKATEILIMAMHTVNSAREKCQRASISCVG